MKIYFLTLISIFNLVFFFNINAQNENKFRKNSEDKPLKILKMPKPKGDLSCPKGSSVIILEMTFHSSGKVTDSKIFEPSPCKVFNKNALKASKKIKFNPEIKNGEPITIVKKVQFSYGLYY